jgi:hypothetical protein
VFMAGSTIVEPPDCWGLMPWLRKKLSGGGLRFFCMGADGRARWKDQEFSRTILQLTRAKHWDKY